MKHTDAYVSAMLGVAVVVVASLEHWPWYISVLAMTGFGLYSLMSLYEQLAKDPKYIALVATLSATASVGRVAMQGIPDFQPATFVIIISGFSLGPATGAAVGAFTAVGSNLFLGEGAWTPWQMLAWGLAGWSAGLMRSIWPKPSMRVLLPFGFAWGFLFGWIMNTWQLVSGGFAAAASFVVLCVQSFWFDLSHAVATAMFIALGGRIVLQILERFRVRLYVHRG